MNSKCGPTKDTRTPVIRMRRDEATDACLLSCHSRVFHITTVSLSPSYLLQSLALLTLQPVLQRRGPPYLRDMNFSLKSHTC